MKKFLTYERGLEKFSPLDRVMVYDDFDLGFNGWLDLTPSFRKAHFLDGFGNADGL